MNIDPSRLEDRVTIATPEGVDLELVVAGIGSRFMARLVDSLLQGAAIFALYLATVTVASISIRGGAAVAFFFIALFAVLFLYDLVWELTCAGRTPGKMAMGLRVVGRSGQPVSPAASAIRNFVRIVDFLPSFYGIGLVAMLASGHSQRLGDLAAGTLVARDRRGDDRHAALEGYAIQTTVPLDAVAHWDVSAVTADEVLAVRQFLSRRLALPADIRYRLGVELASRLAAKVTGLPSQSHPEYVLEGVVVAKDARS